MTFRHLATSLVFTTGMLAGCATMSDDGASLGGAQLFRSDGTAAGSVQLVRDGGMLRVEGTLTGLPPGAHGFHLHTTGRCDAPAFESAGGHLNPYDRAHGKLAPQGKHLGDLDNITVPASGTITVNQSVGSDTQADLARIFDADGTAVMVHSGPDDYRTDPAGDAGSRIACGVMRR